MHVGRLITGIVLAGIMLLLLGQSVLTSCFCFHPRNTRFRTTCASLKILHSAVLQFKMDTGRYPTKEEGLTVLVEKPPDVANWNPAGYLITTKIPTDAWNNDFIYLVTPGERTPFVIISLGADGQKGGQGYDADLYSCEQALRQTRRCPEEEF